MTPDAASSSRKAFTRANGGVGCRRKGSSTISVAPPAAASRAVSRSHTIARSAKDTSVTAAETDEATVSTTSVMRAARMARSLWRAQPSCSSSCATASCRMRFNSLTGRKSPSESPAISSDPSLKAVPPSLPSCSRNCGTSSARLLATLSGTSPRTETSNSPPFQIDLSGPPLCPNTRTSRRIAPTRSGTVTLANDCCAKRNSVASLVRTTR